LNNIESELYALTHRGNPGDQAFYAQSCARARHVLELGTGYGRLIPSLLSGTRQVKSAPARELWGLDRDQHLLAAAKRMANALAPAQRKQVKLVAGDMSDFAFEQAFDRIVLPYNGLYCLLSRRDILRCFRCVKRHLAPSGEFIFDVWAADSFCQDADASEYHDDTGPILTIGHRAQIWDVYEKSRLRSTAQRLDVTYTYVSRQMGTRVMIGIAQRYAPSRELVDLLGQAGLRVKALHGRFTGSRFTPNSPFLIVKAA
jgi:SAM-dependent methyltransferase